MNINLRSTNLRHDVTLLDIGAVPGRISLSAHDLDVNTSANLAGRIRTLRKLTNGDLITSHSRLTRLLAESKSAISNHLNVDAAAHSAVRVTLLNAFQPDVRTANVAFHRVIKRNSFLGSLIPAACRASLLSANLDSHTSAEIMGLFTDVTNCRKKAPDEAKACETKVIADWFEAKGHPTARTHPGGHDGYVHSLGHGVGLDVHEGPNLSVAAGNRTLLQPGHVVSIEPGLYYPERGYGVRVEDTIAFQKDGTRLNLTDFPYDLVVPMK